MIQRATETQHGGTDTIPKWFNPPVTFHQGTLSEVFNYIPEFERRAFGLAQPGNEMSRLNGRLDTIVRLPFRDDQTYVPVGVVSKDYALVPHRAVLDVAARALDDAKIALDQVKAEVKITEYGERMSLSLYLPEKYSFDPGDGHPMALRLECFNSVDGSTRFRALVGWFRFVCSNGLVIGVTRSDLRRRHVGDLSLDDIGLVLSAGINESANERGNFERWRKTSVTPEKLATWVDKDLKEGWGFKAAARTYHIAQTGFDADVVGPYKGSAPSTIPMRPSQRVPGMPNRSENLFNVSQILAWLAKERRDLQEQLDWREQVTGLLKPLISTNFS